VLACPCLLIILLAFVQDGTAMYDEWSWESKKHKTWVQVRTNYELKDVDSTCQCLCLMHASMTTHADPLCRRFTRMARLWAPPACSTTASTRYLS